MRKDQVIHVELNVPYRGKRHYYFGSKSAIFDVLPLEVVGVQLQSIWSNVNLEESDYTNRLCTIRLGHITRKKGNRGRKPSQNTNENDRSDNR